MGRQGPGVQVQGRRDGLDPLGPVSFAILLRVRGAGAGGPGVGAGGAGAGAGGVPVLLPDTQVLRLVLHRAQGRLLL